MKRPSKRARSVSDEETSQLSTEPAGGSGSSAAGGVGAAADFAPASIHGLSEDLLTKIFASLSVKHAWPLRGVCRLWRGVIERAPFSELKLRSFGPFRLEAFSTLVRAGKCNAGFESYGCYVSNDWYSCTSVARARKTLFGVLEAGLDFLATITRHHATGGPKKACFILEPAPGRTAEAVADTRIRDAVLLGALAALHPPATSATGAGGVSPLEELQLGLRLRFKIERRDSTSAAALRTALAPFSNLKCLILEEALGEISEEHAAAFAECLPRLAKLTFEPTSAAAAARLASLPLEELHLLSGSAAAAPHRNGVLAALAGGEAARSLQRISSMKTDIEVSGSSWILSSEDLRALARFSRLESLSGFHVDERASSQDVAHLGAPPVLRTLELLHNPRDTDGASFLEGLATAARDSSCLESLSFDLNVAAPAASSAALADCISAASGVLMRVGMYLERPLTAGEVAALASCSKSERLLIESTLSEVGDILVLQGLRPLTIANRGLSLALSTQDPAVYSAAWGILKSWLHDCVRIVHTGTDLDISSHDGASCVSEPDVLE
eukprot:tig00000158_g10178.t1